MIQKIDHVNIVVQDLEKMAAFYSEVLGLTVTLRVTISGPWIDRTVGLEGVLADVVYLDPPQGPRLELIRYLRPRAGADALPAAPNAPGLRHLAFCVQGIDEIVSRLKRAGIEFFSDIQQVPAEQVTYGGGSRKHIVYFHDPEGNLLEFCEYK